MTNNHCYLFALEIAPMEVGHIYDELPLHCTLMHRFWSKLSPDEFAAKVRPFFEQTPAVLLKAYEHLLLGPKQMAVSEIELTEELSGLHMQLYKILNDLKVDYTAPEWVGEGYRAHASDRKDARLEVGKQHLSPAVYLIEVEVPEHEKQRIIRTKFDLSS